VKFNHIGISVTDIDRSIAFYHDMLGMQPLCAVFPFGGADFEAIMDVPGASGRMCMLGKDTLQLELFEFARSKAKDAEYPVSDRGYSHFGVSVDDIAATYEKFRAAGVRMHSPVITFNGGSMKAIYCRDPDGNVFEILEPAKAGTRAA
jgi:catechol 2,3-dioxygenase-like lactoylglutathione lyase family enzyme